MDNSASRKYLRPLKNFKKQNYCSTSVNRNQILVLVFTSSEIIHKSSFASFDFLRAQPMSPISVFLIERNSMMVC